jgi:hypothetical protein
MTDLDLESKLKSVPVPERSPEYWTDFPAQVRASLRRAPVEFAPRPSRLPRLAWGVSLALACVIFGLASWPMFHEMFQHGRAFRRELAQLPVQLRVLMQDDHGLHYLIADQP